MRDPWFQSVMVQPPALMGRRLKPFSVIHRYTLFQLGNPYAFSGLPGDAETLMQAVAICSRDWKEIGRLLFAGHPWKDAKAWALMWRTLLAKPARFQYRDAVFRQYLADGVSVPRSESADKSGNGAPMSAPAEFHIVRVLMHYYGMTEADAWNCGWSRAICLCSCRGEAEGVAKLLTVDEEEAYDLFEQAQSCTDPEMREQLYKRSQDIFTKVNGARAVDAEVTP